MSEIEAELNRAAAAYWMSVAAKGGGGKPSRYQRPMSFSATRGRNHGSRIAPDSRR
jgi:hypothetical protein